jgi:hypothetical protein
VLCIRGWAVLALGLYVLAVVAVWGGLLRHLQGVYALAMLGQVALGLSIHYGYERFGKRGSAIVVGAGLTVIALGVTWYGGLAWGPSLMAIAVTGILLAMAGGSRGTLQAVTAMGLPTVGLVLSLVIPGTGREQLVPVFLLLWSLAAWPVLAVLGSGRRWAVSAGLGVISILVVVHATLNRSDVDTASLVATAHVDWFGFEALLAVTQTALVGFGIAPQLMTSRALWRWTALGGLALAITPLALAVVTGPWASGWPSLVWWVVVPAVIASGVGLVGMLCTTRQPESLADNAVRTIALGLGATASLLIPLVATPQSLQTLVPALSTACAPLIWSLLLSLALSITGLVAARRDDPIGTTTRYRMRLKPRFRQSLLMFGRDAAYDLREEVYGLITPRAIVPLLVLLATWPAWPFLGTAALVPIFVLFVVPAASLCKRAPLVWASLLGGLLGCGCWILGLAPSNCMAMAAIGVACAWPFVRWRHLNPAWAYSAGMWLVAILWQEIGGPADGLLAVALSLGLVVLATNALAPAGARGLMLTATALWLFGFLVWWVPTQDPYFPLLLQGENRWREIGTLLLRLPVLTLVLTMLWLSRHRMDRPGWRMPRWQRGLFGVAAVCAAALWASGVQINLWLGLASWVVLLAAVVPVTTEIGDGERVRIWEPVVDAVSFLVAILVVAVGTSAELSSASGDIEPGRLGLVLIDALRDLIALGVSVGALLIARSVGSRFAQVRQGMEYMQTIAVGLGTMRAQRGDKIKKPQIET